MLKARKRSGLKAKALDERPKRNAVIDWYVEAYFKLRKSSGLFETEKYIPLTEIKAYLDIFDCISSKEQFVSVIQEFDNVYTAVTRRKLNHARKQFSNQTR